MNHICPQIYTVWDEMLYDDAIIMGRGGGAREIRRGKTCVIPGDLPNGFAALALIPWSITHSPLSLPSPGPVSTAVDLTLWNHFCKIVISSLNPASWFWKVLLGKKTPHNPRDGWSSTSSVSSLIWNFQVDPGSLWMILAGVLTCSMPMQTGGIPSCNTDPHKDSSPGSQDLFSNSGDTK